MAKKPLIDWTDAELHEALRRESEVVIHSYNSMVAELDRRSQERRARAIFGLSIAVTATAIISTTIAVASFLLRA